MSPHEVLGVASSATKAEVDAAYRALAQIYHPDRHAGASEPVRVEAERRMKELNSARDEMLLRLQRANSGSGKARIQCQGCGATQAVDISKLSALSCQRCGRPFVDNRSQEPTPASDPPTKPNPTGGHDSTSTGDNTARSPNYSPERGAGAAAYWVFGILLLVGLLLGIEVITQDKDVGAVRSSVPSSSLPLPTSEAWAEQLSADLVAASSDLVLQRPTKRWSAASADFDATSLSAAVLGLRVAGTNGSDFCLEGWAGNRPRLYMHVIGDSRGTDPPQDGPCYPYALTSRHRSLSYPVARLLAADLEHSGLGCLFDLKEKLRKGAGRLMSQGICHNTAGLPTAILVYPQRIKAAPDADLLRRVEDPTYTGPVVTARNWVVLTTSLAQARDIRSAIGGVLLPRV